MSADVAVSYPYFLLLEEEAGVSCRRSAPPLLLLCRLSAPHWGESKKQPTDYPAHNVSSSANGKDNTREEQWKATGAGES